MEKRRLYGLLICTFLLLVFYIFITINGSYGFTPMQAVEAFFDDEDNIEIFGEVKRDWAIVYLIDTSKGAKTVLVLRKGFLWHGSAATYFYDDVIKNDLVKTNGWMSLSNEENKQITVFAVQVNDPRVKYIEAGLGLEREKVPILLSETVIFEWDKKLPWNDLGAVALDKDNRKLYRYGYPQNTSFFKSEDLRWYQIDNE